MIEESGEKSQVLIARFLEVVMLGVEEGTREVYICLEVSNYIYNMKICMAWKRLTVLCYRRVLVSQTGHILPLQ